MTPHMLLEELGVPFELKLVDRSIDAQRSPAYLQLNPNGKIPVLVDGDLVLYETGAIVMYLLDAHPQARLAPPPGTPARAHFHKWLFWLGNSVHAEMQLYFYPERYVDAGNEAGAAQVKAHAERRIAGLFDQIEAELARHGGPWFLGSEFSALDPYVFMFGRWTRMMNRPARTLPHLGRYLERVHQRPAVQRAFATEKLSPPPY